MGLLRKRKKWGCLYPYVCAGSQREEKIEGIRYSDRNSKTEEKRKKSKGRENKKKRRCKDRIKYSVERMFTGINLL